MSIRTTALLIFCLAAVLLCHTTAHAQPGPVLFSPPLSPRIANYNIDVRLDAESKMLDGQEVLIWHNQSRDAIDELQFHLYLNAFRNTETTLMKESGSRTRGKRVPDNGWGFIEVASLKVNYAAGVKTDWLSLTPSTAWQVVDAAHDLTSEMRFIQPDDGNKNDRTVFAVPLPRPLRPGEAVAVHIDFRAKLPEPPIERSGAKKEFFFVAQWFPKIGVYADDGWNTHQYHYNSEFFADFGVYNVRMTVPDSHIVGATGVEVEVTDNSDGTRTHVYHAEDVHDFAWSASPEFVEFTGRADDVDIRLLLQPDHVDLAERHLRAAQYAIETFQDWYGDYPYPNLTLVDPRRGAAATGGMEYPTFIATFANYRAPRGIHLLEEVVIHEFGHNYWYLMLASNEFEESWLDEGINTYTDIQLLGNPHGPAGAMVDFLGIELSPVQYHRVPIIFGGDRDPILRKSWEFYSSGSYGVNSYAKPGIVLTTLKNYLGEGVMRKVMRTYVERWRFRHPTSQNFFDIVNEVSGQDMSWFLEQAFRTTKELDYAVTRVFTRKINDPKGFDYTLSTSQEDTSLIQSEPVDKDTGSADTAVADDEAALADTGTEKSQAAELYHSGVNVRRLGEFQFPVQIEVVFEDGEIRRETWDGKALWKKFRYTRPAKLAAATVDPEGKIPLDINLTNNSKTVEKQARGVNKLSARWLFWMQFLLEQPDFINLVIAGGSTLF